MRDIPDRNVSASGRLGRIRRVSGVMSAGCLALAFLMVIGPILYWALTPGFELLANAKLGGLGHMEPDLLMRFLAILVTAIPIGLLIVGLLNARGCFTAFSEGDILSHRPAACLWRVSVAVGLSAMAQPFAAAALSVLLSWNGPPGTKTLSLSIGTDTLLLLSFAAFIAVVSWVMHEAAVVAAENSQFI